MAISEELMSTIVNRFLELTLLFSAYLGTLNKVLLLIFDWVSIYIELRWLVFRHGGLHPGRERILRVQVALEALFEFSSRLSDAFLDVVLVPTGPCLFKLSH